MQSDSELVKEFTEAAGFDIPKAPEKMSKEEVSFLVKMVIDELMELYATVDTSDNYKQSMKSMIDEARDYNIDYEGMSDTSIISEQADALVDAYYYMQNAAVKKGTNLSRIFKIVHEANMAKRDPVTGKFLRREDGKIIKPDGWKEPNINKEIQKQIDEGPF